MPKPLPSNYPKEQRWVFVQRSLPTDQLISFAASIVEHHNEELHQELHNILRFYYPEDVPYEKLYHRWLSLWDTIMHQCGLGYTVTNNAISETRIMATDLSQYLVDTGNTDAYYYYWALRFQFPYAFPKHAHYLRSGVLVQPVVLISQYLDYLERSTGEQEQAYLTGYEITQFLMRSPNHSKPTIQGNCSEIITNRQRGYDYASEREDKEFEKATNQLFSRGRLYLSNFNLLTFSGNRISVDEENLAKLRVFLSYRKPPFAFEANSQDVRNQFFIEAYCDLDPAPDALFENVNGEIPNPLIERVKQRDARPSASRRIINPEDKRGIFTSGTRAERKFQTDLKRDMVDLYEGRCCVCGLDRPGFLIASHIVAVRVDPSIAADRQNCLLLCVLHDRAFEKGYFGLLDDYTIIVNHDKTLDHPILEREITNREGQRINLPDEETLYPSIEYIRRHRMSHGITNMS